MINTDELIEKLFKNNANQEYIVLNVEGRNQSGNKKYKIRFLETGYERVVEKVEIERGKIKDKLAKSVFGIGILGNIKMVDYKREYSVWSGMLERCYNPPSDSYKSYGAKGVKVCKRWHYFTNFIEDIKLIDGYDEQLFQKGKIFLDKDIKQLNKQVGDRVYSPETCTFVSYDVNFKYANFNHRKNKFFALSPNGEVTEEFGIREFAKTNGLIKQGIISCLKGRASIHKGWKFSYRKEDLLNEIA
ncbi:hypothetical protein [Heyndrickxia camelliae]|uniref:Uncharacterized protein n=1 Tax=Heyndrickxia camelliae TaxID=1707093 RepID=A0A2N3LFX4_9BACI|nr:hypothetical protein [Heyndrickxia camelliae]PKR83552.1 hypothetical protein CWO92_18475 [Heyndrickxia camelliae]